MKIFNPDTFIILAAIIIAPRLDGLGSLLFGIGVLCYGIGALIQTLKNKE